MKKIAFSKYIINQIYDLIQLFNLVVSWIYIQKST